MLASLLRYPRPSYSTPRVCASKRKRDRELKLWKSNLPATFACPCSGNNIHKLASKLAFHPSLAINNSQHLSGYSVYRLLRQPTLQTSASLVGRSQAQGSAILPAAGALTTSPAPLIAYYQAPCIHIRIPADRSRQSLSTVPAIPSVTFSKSHPSAA